MEQRLDRIEAGLIWLQVQHLGVKIRGCDATAEVVDEAEQEFNVRTCTCICMYQEHKRRGEKSV